MPDLKERAAFTLSASVKTELELRVPKSRRSQFVEDAIARALDEDTRAAAIAAIDRIKRYPVKDVGAVETVRRLRSERDAVLTERHKRAGG